VHSGRLILIGLALMGVALVVGKGLTQARFGLVLGTAFVIAVFIFVFVKTEAGLYLVLFSMLLSPEFGAGGGQLAEGRTVIIRLEDLLLLAICLSWFAKMAVNKDMGLVVKTPLNRWILFYILGQALATLLGYSSGSVKTAAGFFYVLKYVEYFVVYYMTVNYLRDREQAWRLVTTAFVTAALVSMIGAAQIPSGARVSAPFEGEAGEPNTLGGYLILMMGLAAGLALETERLRTRLWSLGLLALMSVPFIFTLSRASYVGAVGMIGALVVLSSRRKLMIGAAVLVLASAPLILPSLLPKAVTRRVLYTFEPERGQTTARLGHLAFDPSTSQRLVSMQDALGWWLRRPLFGYGVTGYRFLDAQFVRILVETGVVGLTAFLALLVAVLRGGLQAFRTLRDPDDRGIALGFLAGTVGLIIHALGSNTFIIVRIMEPFWFFAGIVFMLPMFERPPEPVAVRRPLPAFGFTR
jgi:O-antigen ligase